MWFKFESIEFKKGLKAKSGRLYDAWVLKGMKKGFENEPSRCKDCRAANKAARRQHPKPEGLHFSSETASSDMSHFNTYDGTVEKSLFKNSICKSA